MIEPIHSWDTCKKNMVSHLLYAAHASKTSKIHPNLPKQGLKWEEHLQFFSCFPIFFHLFYGFSMVFLRFFYGFSTVFAMFLVSPVGRLHELLGTQQAVAVAVQGAEDGVGLSEELGRSPEIGKSDFFFFCGKYMGYFWDNPWFYGIRWCYMWLYSWPSDWFIFLWEIYPRCSMVLEYWHRHLPLKMAQLCRCQYSSTMVRIWLWDDMRYK